MTKGNINSKKGFTIIEVVLVLAIAGLIFLMVFIALPNLQRSQRDTQRRNDYSSLSANMTAYMTNNNGSLPADGVGNTVLGANAAKNYINKDGTDPNGLTYGINVYTCTSADCPGTADNTTNFKFTAPVTTSATQVRIIKKATCNGGFVKYLNSTRAFAILGQLESGNGYYCTASQ